MEIKKLLTPYNHTDSTEKRIEFIVIHFVGALGDAKQNCQYYASADRGASAHYFVGFDGEVYQSVLDSNVAWHCGSKNPIHPKCRNANSIGIEMCVRKKDEKHLGAEDRDWYFEDATVKTTIELTKMLMEKYNVPVENVIRHFDVTGKICPNPYVFNDSKHTWKAFKKAITTKKTVKETVKKVAKKVVSGVKNKVSITPLNTSYKVTILAEELNIRSNCDVDSKAVGQVHKDEVYTIVQTKNNWGKLKSGLGWISLKYTEKV